MDNKYVLAMYDVRGKQDYIFRGRKLKEIVGGSLVIRDIFKDELYPAAEEYNKGIFNYKKNSRDDSAFSRKGFEKHLQEGYIGEVVYDGGGNFFVLYKDMDTFREINKKFTKRVLVKTYSLTVLCSCIENVDFDNYTTLLPENSNEELRKKVPLGDREKLYQENRKREARINPQMPAQVLPFTQVDYANSLPLYDYNYSVKRKLTKEAWRKYEKFEFIQNDDSEYSEKVLDNIVREKGEDSWLAVIYIDGNNMGAKVQKILRDKEDVSEIEEPIKVSYEKAIERLRGFSDKIQKDYIDDRIAAIDDALQMKYKNNDSYKRRLVVYAGDEINIIVNAHDAFDAVKAYFKGMPEDGSACAGIAIFKSHMPYADAYRIAEQCCENAKQKMKEKEMKEANLIDFHYCQGVIGVDIEEIRAREVGDLISKPWFVRYSKEQCGNISVKEVITFDMVEDMVEKLNTCTRSNIKGLLNSAKDSESELFTELTRMQLRKKGDAAKNVTTLKGADGEALSRDQLRKLIYDIVSVYDLWFRREGK